MNEQHEQTLRTKRNLAVRQGMKLFRQNKFIDAYRWAGYARSFQNQLEDSRMMHDLPPLVNFRQPAAPLMRDVRTPPHFLARPVEVSVSTTSPELARTTYEGYTSGIV